MTSILDPDLISLKNVFFISRNISLFIYKLESLFELVENNEKINTEYIN